MAEQTARWVIRDDEGKWVETHVGVTREEAIRLFCHPLLLWPPYEAEGWTVTQEPMDAPLGEPSIANMEAVPPPR